MDINIKKDIGGKERRMVWKWLNLECKTVETGRWLEVGVDKSRDLFSDRMMGSNNGAARVIGFMDVRDRVESGDWGCGGGRCLGRRDHEGGQCFEGE